MTTHNTHNTQNALHLIGTVLLLVPICLFLGSFLLDHRHLLAALAFFAPTYLGFIVGIKLFTQRAQLIERGAQFPDYMLALGWIIGGLYFWVLLTIAYDLIP